MEFHILLVTARSAVIELEGDDICYTEEYKILINGKEDKASDRMVESIYGLAPDTDYTICLARGEMRSVMQSIHTNKEFVTLNVRDFGAKGDWTADDTRAIQAAIMCCPENSRVLVPPGTFKIHNLFLKSNLILELAEGAVLSAFGDKKKLPLLPGMIESYDETGEYNIASWEGNPLDSYASLLTGIQAENVLICGQGILDGQGSFENWWNVEKRRGDPPRPRMLFLNRCRNVILQGITLKNSPAWNIHPYFSRQLRFLDIRVEAPGKSHNTDGLNPESCSSVEIIGVHFSVGDDCIAVKSGKLYMGRKYRTPSKDIQIRQCHMESGHGAVTLGSEIAAGVKNVSVSKCLFTKTDRGLRIKTRRGRGRESVVENISFTDIFMDQVKSPFVVNCFYYCDPEGKSDYVACKEPLPVDYRTPAVKSLSLSHIICKNACHAGCYIYGLPERKIESVSMEDIKISFAPDAPEGRPALMRGCEPVKGLGIFVRNVEKLYLKQIVLEGIQGKEFDIEDVDTSHIE